MKFIKRNTKIFLISGKARSGKGEISNIIENYYKEKKCITISFAYYLKDYVKRITNWDGSEKTKPREMLQQLGIELIKNQIDDKLLINRILQDIEVFSYFYDIIIISDARLIDEIECVKEKYKDSIVIRVIRNNNNNLTINQKTHITEIGLDNYNNFDYIVSNNNYESLINQVEDILRSVDYE
jgi:hypothetical protein